MKVRSWLRGFDRLWRGDRSGLASLELALSLPLILVAGGYGIELANYAIVNLRVSQVALNLADNASRVGMMDSLSIVQLRESDLNDVLDAARLQGDSIDLTTHGRIVMSSLENIQQTYDVAPVQRIHWQRCLGTKSGAGYDSSYGTTTITDGITPVLAAAGTTMAAGMGDAGYKVNAPSGSGVVFVEINYDYQRLFGSMFMAPTKIQHIASLIVRDKRDFAQVYNPSPAATRMTCDKYTV
jgi:Flp pilus assembly protein TadG